ncbi:MAG TPA: nucleoside recognition domain-containing protein [Clostridia bacterium]|nr:nucleoside recognition domain-containing protein [Clostridia bacterium]
MIDVTVYVLPIVVAFIVLWGMVKGEKIFDCFLEGARDGMKTAVSLLPPLMGLITAVSMMKASGALDVIVWALSPIAKVLGIPEEVMPLTVISPISGSGSLTVFESIMQAYGPDSMAGRVAGVIMGSTETTFYAITVYFGSVGIKKSGYTIPCALSADLTGYICSAWAVRLLL